MPKVMKLTAAVSLVLTAVFALLYGLSGGGALLALAITCGTVAYHFGMRLLVGLAFDRFMRNKADYTKKWYQLNGWEKKLYRLINVKKWKGKMPTYDPDVFDPHKHTWDEIAQAMCQSELVHETNAVLSFLPVIAAAWFGELPVFAVTSLLGAAYDLLFAVMQRYNRPRIIRHIGVRRKSGG